MFMCVCVCVCESPQTSTRVSTLCYLFSFPHQGLRLSLWQHLFLQPTGASSGIATCLSHVSFWGEAVFVRISPGYYRPRCKGNVVPKQKQYSTGSRQCACKQVPFFGVELNPKHFGPCLLYFAFPCAVFLYVFLPLLGGLLWMCASPGVSHLAMGHTLCLHFGADEHPCTTSSAGVLRVLTTKAKPM